MALHDQTSSGNGPDQDGDSARAEERIRSVDGLRLTAQRREVLAVLLASSDHPGATEIYQRASGRLDNLSLATVYNCLEALVERGAVQQVTGDRHNARYCANLEEHAHFYCNICGQVFDLLPVNDRESGAHWQFPEGVAVARIETSVHGHCLECVVNSDQEAKPG